MFRNFKYRGEKNKDGKYVYTHCSQSLKDKDKIVCIVSICIGAYGTKSQKCLRSISREIDKTDYIKISNWFRTKIEVYEQILKSE